MSTSSNSGRRALVVSCAAIAGMITTSAFAGTYGYWRFEEASPTADAMDSGPNGITLTRLPDASRSTSDLPASVPYVNTTAASFNGSSGVFASNAGIISDNAAVDIHDPGAGDFTLEGWIKVNSGDGYLFGKDHQSGNASEDRGYRMQFEDTDLGSFRLRYALRTTAGGFFDTDIQSGEVSYGEWHHIAGIRQAGDLFMYVDGVKQVEQRLGTLAGKDFRSRVPFTVGSGVDGGSPNSAAIFATGSSARQSRTVNGGIDEVRLSNRALFPSQFLNAVNPEWNVNADGNWSTAGNWTVAVPNAVDAVANFADAITAPHTVTVDAPQTVIQLNFDNAAAAYTVAGTSTLTIGGTAGYVGVINSIAGSHAITAPVQLDANLDVDVSGGSDTLTVSGDVSAVAGVVLTKTGAGTLAMKNVRTDTLTVSGGKVQVLTDGSDAGTSRVNNLNLAGGATPTATLDLGDNDLVVDYGDTSPLADITAQIISGRAGGAWNGAGINSSAAAANPATALGIGEASTVLGAGGGTFSGQSVDGTAVLVKYTYAGDSNLDGKVDVGDLGNLASNWQQPAAWTGGDFDYSGTVNVGDLGILATNWQQGVTTPTLGPSFAEALAALGLPGASVPEPAGSALVLSMLLAGISRRRRLPR